MPPMIKLNSLTLLSLENTTIDKIKTLYLIAVAVLISTAGIVTPPVEGGAVFLLMLQVPAVLILILYTIRLYKIAPKYILSSMFQIYVFAGLLVSLSVSSHGIYMFEVARSGSPNFAFWVCLGFCVAGMEAGLAGFRSAPKLGFGRVIAPRFSRSLDHIVLYAAPMIMLASACLILFALDGPVLAGVGRIAFWQTMVPPWLERFPSAFGQSFFLVAFFWFLRTEKRQGKILPAALVVGYLLATAIVLGEKFSVFVLYFVMWCFVWSGSNPSGKLSLRTLQVVACMVAALVVLVVTTYVSQGREATFIVQRIALQAELLWSVMNEGVARLLSGGDLSCTFGCGEFSSGTEFISARYMPPELYQRYQASSSGLTGFMPSLPILLYGIPFALLLHMAISFVLGGAQWYAVRTIEVGGLIPSILSFKLYYGLMIAWYTMNSYVLYGVGIALVLLLFLSMFPKSSRDLRRDGTRVVGV